MGLRIPTGRRQTSWLFTSVVAREFELGTIQNKSSKRSGRDFNSGLRDYKSSALTARPHCLLLLRLMICCFFVWFTFFMMSDVITSSHLRCMFLKPRANGRNIVGCYMVRPFAHLVACCWMLLRVVAQSLKTVKHFSQQLPTFLLLRDRRSVAQQCWIRLHSSSNIVGATHAHYAWFTKTYGLHPSHDALQVPTLLGVDASVCTPLPTRSQQLPTLLA